MTTEDEIHSAAGAKLAQLAEHDAELQAAAVTPADFAFVRRRGTSSIQLLAAACERYATRPCLGTRAAVSGSAFGTITYGELWARVVAVASGLHEAGAVRAGDLVGILGRGSVSWVVADLALAYLGAVCVPLQVSFGEEDLHHVVNEAGLTCVIADVSSVGLTTTVVKRSPGVRALIVMGDDCDEQHAVTTGRATLTDRTVLGLAAVEARGRSGSPALPMVVPSRGQTPPVSVLYTSGSTGRPKGVVWLESRWMRTLHRPLERAAVPVITVGYLPLSHSAGRIGLYTTMIVGGVTYFTANPDMSTLLEDIALVRPTSMTLVPRVSSLVYQHFQSQLLRRGAAWKTPTAMLEDPLAQPLFTEIREKVFGGRLVYVPIGAAPTPPEVIAFLERCLETHVINAYGSTEIGTVAVNGRVVPGVTYKLVDAPELGYGAADKPYPRGELAVKSAMATPGYFRNESASSRLRDAEGYVLSGDIVEERAPGHLAWVDRRNNVVRLAQGEFVNVSRLEDLYPTASPFIEQCYVYANSLRSYVLAVVVPNREALATQLGVAIETTPPEPDVVERARRFLRSELDRAAQSAGLAGHEVPRDFVVEWAPFTKENGLLTDANKPRRPKLKETYGSRLEELYVAIEARQLRVLDLGADAGIEQRVRSAIAVTLGLEASDVDAGRTFTQLGGDSFAAVRLAALLQEHCNVAIPVPTILDPKASVATIVARIETMGVATQPFGFDRIHGKEAEWARSKDLRIERFVDAELLEQASKLPAPRACDSHATSSRRSLSASMAILLTGATGFLGRFLLLQLLEQLATSADANASQVICIVRASSDEEARERVRSGFRCDAGDDLVTRLDALAERSRLVILAGNLMERGFGLATATYERLAREVDTVVHCGALVNHVLSYEHLFEPNVLGTAEIARFAVTAQKKAIHFVSTTGVTAGRRAGAVSLETERAADLWSRRPIRATDYAAGYITSKWACELLLRDLHDRCGVPVSISRCGMVLPHSAYVGHANERDAFSRLIYGIVRTGIAPLSFYADDAAESRHYDGLPVDLVARFVASVATQGSTVFETFHVTNDNWDDGVSMDTIVDWLEAAGYSVTRLPYAEWHARSRGELERLSTSERDRSHLAILERWARPIRGNEGIHRVDARAFRARLREVTGARGVPSMDAAYIATCLRSICGPPRETARVQRVQGGPA